MTRTGNCGVMVVPCSKAFFIAMSTNSSQSCCNSSLFLEVIRTVFALAGGEIVPITQVNDPVFAGKMMGDGFAIIPSSGVITSPVKGEVVNVFPTLHAVGIQTSGGLEVLVHMGIDTVELKGGPFETTVTVGQKVDEHTVLSTVDLEALKEAGKDTAMMVLFTNMDKVESIVIATEGTVEGKTEVGKVTLKA